jgi:hypothetical protein
MQVVKESEKLIAAANKLTQFHKVRTSASNGMLETEDSNQDVSFTPDPMIIL